MKGYTTKGDKIIKLKYVINGKSHKKFEVYFTFIKYILRCVFSKVGEELTLS